MIPPEELDDLRERDSEVIPRLGRRDDPDLLLRAEMDRRALLAEYDRLHSWTGLMELLDEHWPTDIFPMPQSPEHFGEYYVQVEDDTFERANPGVRIVGLMRWLDKVSKERDEWCEIARRLEGGGES